MEEILKELTAMAKRVDRAGWVGTFGSSTYGVDGSMYGFGGSVAMSGVVETEMKAPRVADVKPSSLDDSVDKYLRDIFD